MAAHSTLGMVLKRYRVTAGLSQERLAERAMVSTRAISDLERGLHHTPRADTLDRLAHALALSADQRAALLAAAHPEVDAAPGASIAPARAPSTISSPLPLPPTPLIGRDPERQSALAWLHGGSTRLLTLTGPGGVGKTRLALAITHDLAATFPDSVCYVELASLRDAAQASTAIMGMLGLHEQPGQSPTEPLRAHLREKRLLLVLDNCEHLPRVALLVADLLAHCPYLVILATSRIPLRLRGERALPLGPLPLDDAVALFHARALAARPDGVYDEPEIVAICERLDCLPLAIELAAVWVRVLPLPQLRDRLARRLPLLRAGAADLPDRQRTMEDAIHWSYSLLSEEQRRCFRALGVFTGGCMLDAARAVCWELGTVASHEALATLAAVVDAGLLQTETVAEGQVRFRLLELMREYALERLGAAGEEDTCRRRHAAYYATLADDALFFGPGPHASDAGLARELPNVRAALEWAEANRESDLGLHLVGFARLWHLRGDLSEAHHWQERMLALDSAVRAQGGPAASLSLRARRLFGFSRNLLAAGKLEYAEAVAQEALALAEDIGDADAIGNAYMTLGLIAQARGHLAAAEESFTISAAHAESAGPGNLYLWALTNLAEMARARGNLPRAEELLTEALARARAVGNTWEAAMIVTLLGHTARQRRQYARARAHYRQSLALFSAFDSPPFLAWCLEGLAATLAAEGEAASAVGLYAASARMRERAGAPAPPQEYAEIERILDDIRATLGGPVFRAEWASFATLTQEQIVAEALALAAEPPS
ncbi:MAG: tetratricopeptide repeat protein [Chloroflexota bacterium]|nr:tetratricopeptide repeat protein [Chloroflexota bacterium]